MVRLRHALLAKRARKEVFDFSFLRAKTYAKQHPTLACDFLVRALGSSPKNEEALRLGVEIGGAVGQEGLSDKCFNALVSLGEQRRSAAAANAEGQHVPKEGRNEGEEEEHAFLESLPSPREEQSVEAFSLPLVGISDEMKNGVKRLFAGAVEVKEPPSSIYGRGLYATRKVSKGTVLGEETAFSSYPMRDTVCAHCLAQLPRDPVRCDGCDETYCSPGCREAALHLYHAPICRNVEYKQWKQSVDDIFRDETSSSQESAAALQLLHVGRICATGTLAQEHPRLMDPLSELRGAIEYHPRSTFLTLGGAVMGLGAALRQEHLYLEDIVALLATLRSNEWRVEHGFLLFRYFSLLNHSCVPNVAMIGDATGTTPGNRRKLVALTDVRANDQLFIDYTSVLGAQLPYVQRHDYLRERNVECHCSKCVRQK